MMSTRSRLRRLFQKTSRGIENSDDEGDVVIKFYEALAKKYGYTITVLKREEQVAYTQLFESVK